MNGQQPEHQRRKREQRGEQRGQAESNRRDRDEQKEQEAEVNIAVRTPRVTLKDREQETKSREEEQRNGTLPVRRQGQEEKQESESAQQPEQRGKPRRLVDRCGQWVRQHARIVLMVGSVLLAATVIVVLAVWAIGEKSEADAARRKATTEHEQMIKAEAEAKKERAEAQEARHAASRERHHVQADLEDARRRAQEAKAVLAFLRDKLLAAGRPSGWISGRWAEGYGKNVTLLQAVDAAQGPVSTMFKDRPLVEATVREVLGGAYLDLGEAKKAVKDYERALALREALLGPDHPETIQCRNELARAYRLAGHATEAGRLYDNDPNSLSHASALATRGALLLAQNKPADAALKLREALAIRQRLQPDDWTTFETGSLLGEALVAQKKYTEAEPLLLSSYHGLKKHAPQIPSQEKRCITRALERLVRLYDAWQKPADAGKWRKLLETARGK